MPCHPMPSPIIWYERTSTSLTSCALLWVLSGAELGPPSLTTPAGDVCQSVSQSSVVGCARKREKKKRKGLLKRKIETKNEITQQRLLLLITKIRKYRETQKYCLVCCLYDCALQSSSNAKHTDMCTKKAKETKKNETKKLVIINTNRKQKKRTGLQSLQLPDNPKSRTSNTVCMMTQSKTKNPQAEMGEGGTASIESHHTCEAERRCSISALITFTHSWWLSSSSA